MAIAKSMADKSGSHLRVTALGARRARVIYYFHYEHIPLFALTAYAKNEWADLSQGERSDFRRLTARLAEAYARRRMQ